MRQKVHPVRLRLGITCFFRTHWYAKGRSYSAFIQEDNFIRKFLETLPIKYILNSGFESRLPATSATLFSCWPVFMENTFIQKNFFSKLFKLPDFG